MGGNGDVARRARYATKVVGLLHEKRELKGELGFSGSAGRHALAFGRPRGRGVMTIPLADDFPHDAGRDPTAEDGVEFGVTRRERFVGIGQE